MSAMIPYGRQDISDADIQAVVDVLKSDYLTQGPAVPAFEQSVAKYCGSDYAVAVNSATSALHIACLALGLGPGDWLWTSPNTFVASANCALYCGAQVDFVDISSQTYNMSVNALSEKLMQAERDGRLPKIIIPVHFAGQSCEMREIKKLADQYGIKIIEDAAHAIGGRYLDAPVGNCQFSDITVFSFHPVKIITTGEGGLATTQSATLARRMQLLRSHYITRQEDEVVQADVGYLYYEQLGLGYNYRMTDIHAALGISQMQRLDEFVSRRHEIANVYNECLQGLSLVRPWQHPDSFSAFHLYVVNMAKSGKERMDIIDRLRLAGIIANIHYIPVHTQPYYQSMGFKLGDFPVAESYYAGAISIPMYPTLSEEEQGRVVRVLTEVFTETVDLI